MKSVSLASFLNALESVTGVLAPDSIKPDRPTDSIGDNRHGGLYLADLGKLHGDNGTISVDIGEIPGVTDRGTIPGVTSAGTISGDRVEDKGTVAGVRDVGTVPGVISMGTISGVTVEGIGTIPGVRVEDKGTSSWDGDIGTTLGVTGFIPGVTGDIGTIPGVTGVITVYPGWNKFPKEAEGLLGVE